MSARSVPVSVFVAWFEREEDILAATYAARRAGLVVHDTYTPYAVHGMDEAMGIQPSRLPYVCFGAGLTGLSCAWGLQYWASVVSWPLNVGGKPAHSLPAFIPVMFELTVLFAALTTVAALFLRERLIPGARAKVIKRVTDDRFALALDASADGFDRVEARALLEHHGAVETAVEEVSS
jgi:hypothetical protein